MSRAPGWRPATLVGRLSAAVVAMMMLGFVLAGVGVFLVLAGELQRGLDEQVQAASVRYEGYRASRSASDDDADNQAGVGVGQVEGTVLGPVAGPVEVVTHDGSVQDVPPETRRLLTAVGLEAPTSIELPGLGDYRVLVSDGHVVGLPAEPSHVALWRAVLGGGLLLLVVGCTTLVASFTTLRRQTRPLRELADRAVQVSGSAAVAGSLGEPDPTGPRELRELHSSIDSLLARVSEELAGRAASEARLRDFMADASHELKTPLALLRAHSELLRGYRGQGLPAEVTGSLGRIEAETVRMSQLVDDLVMLVHLDEDPQRVRAEADLSLIVIEAVDGARLLAPEHRWLVDLPADPVVVVGDAAQLQRLVANLVTNARVHTPAGTTVKVSLAVSGADPGDDPSEVTLTVADDGPGLPDAVRSGQPQRFARGRNRASGGSGLGLAICAAIVEAHRGAWQLNGGRGTTVRVSLPAGAGQRPGADSGAVWGVVESGAESEPGPRRR